MNERIQLYCYDKYLRLIFFVRFLEEIEDTKKTFWNQLTFNNLAIMERIHIGSFVINIRLANVVADHNDLLTQWRPIKMS